VKEIYTLADLKTRKNKTSIRLGVFGNPIAHSFSPQMQNAALKACKIDMQYARFQVLPEELQSALELVRQSNFIGLNLTTRHKIAACQFVERIDDHARRIGAINRDRKSTRLNSSHLGISYAVFCL